MVQQLAEVGALEARHAEAVRLIEGGKRIGDAVYLHETLLASQPTTVQELAAVAAGLINLPAAAFNVVRFSTRRPEVAFLYYPEFLCFDASSGPPIGVQEWL